RRVPAAATAGRWVRAVGYHETVAGPLDAAALDAMVADRPLRVQHRSGELWMLNSAAMAAVGLADADHPGVERDAGGRPTGRLWRMDTWLAGRVPPAAADLAAVGRRAAAAGVTGFTDATPDRRRGDAEDLAAALPQRIYAMGPAGDPEEGPGGGTGVPGECPVRTAGGAPSRPGGDPGAPGRPPVKVMLDDTSLPEVGTLAAVARAAHSGGRGIAVHCVTGVQLAVTLAALQEAGPPPAGGADRVEHGAVVNPDHRRLLRRLGVTVVTQPAMAAERGDDYLREVDPDERGLLWPLASLVAAGVRVAGGTDAPFGPGDPWVAVAAAVQRRTPAGAVLGAGERVGPWAALRLFLGHATRPWQRRRVEVGARADLCLLATPLADTLWGLARGIRPPVRATVRGDEIIHGEP
ncbi:MAG TPA: amidohydrolase family protein, partial [Acidimicrobiales bacterium]|nr:amidohydrolase family protein [Acidimicrobiales bacterium]